MGHEISGIHCGLRVEQVGTGRHNVVLRIRSGGDRLKTAAIQFVRVTPLPFIKRCERRSEVGIPMVCTP